MAAHTVKSATLAEIADVADLLTLAFSTDPAARWSWADPRVYLASFPRFVRAFGGAAFQCGTAHVAEGNKGAALWLPPGAEPDEEAMGVLMQETVPAHIGKDGIAVMQQMANFAVAEMSIAMKSTMDMVGCRTPTALAAAQSKFLLGWLSRSLSQSAALCAFAVRSQAAVMAPVHKTATANARRLKG